MNTAYRIEIIGDSVDGTHHGSQTYTVTLVDPQDTSNAGTIVQSRRESKTTFRLKNVDNAKVQQPEVEEHIVYPNFPENFLQVSFSENVLIAVANTANIDYSIYFRFCHVSP